MLIGYNTNGFAHHRVADAIAILSEIGYGSVAVTLEHDLLDPPDRNGVAHCVKTLAPILGATDLSPCLKSGGSKPSRDREGAGSRGDAKTASLRARLGNQPPLHALCCTIETGSRFILDPRRKHQPTLISGDANGRRRRVEFLKAAVEVAAELHADSVSLWSGAPDDAAESGVLWDRLTGGLCEVLEHAETRSVRLSFEPEPGMIVATMADFERLHRAVDHPLLGLTLDVGHVHCLRDGEVGDHVRRWRDVLWNVHIEDMPRDRHEHLMFGEGDMDFHAVFRALREVNYAGPVHVELSRHSHDAVNAAIQAYHFLNMVTRDSISR